MEDNIENHITPTAKQILSTKIDYESFTNYSNPFINQSHTKINVLKPNQSPLLEESTTVSSWTWRHFNHNAWLSLLGFWPISEWCDHWLLLEVHWNGAHHRWEEKESSHIQSIFLHRCQAHSLGKAMETSVSMDKECKHFRKRLHYRANKWTIWWVFGHYLLSKFERTSCCQSVSLMMNHRFQWS